MSSYSFLFGTMRPAELCQRALRAGYLRVGLMDWGGVYGHPEFAQEAEALGLQALFGVELGRGGSRLFALAQNELGYRSLCRLVSDWRMETEAWPTKDLTTLAEIHAEGLLFFAEDPAFAMTLFRRLGPQALRIFLPPGQDHGCPASTRALADRSAGGDGLLRKVPNPAPVPRRSSLLAVAREYGIKLVAAPTVVYGESSERGRHLLAVAAKEGVLLRELEAEQAAGRRAYLPSLEELRAAYADCPEALAEAERVAASCSLSLARPRPTVLPVLHEGRGGDDAATILASRCRSGFEQRYRRTDEAVRARAQGRLDRELQVVHSLGFDDYFLIVDEIVGIARQEGIPVLGRGSAADSIVSYCLGFTDADPLRYGLCFERFLNPARFERNGRVSLPDIDLDFCWRRRDRLLELVRDRFGKEHFAMFCTHPTLGFRAAYREAARCFGLGQAEVDRRSRGLPRKLPEDLKFSRQGLRRLFAENPVLRARLAKMPGGEAARLRERRIWWGAFALTGLQRCLGLHPGGTVLSPVPIRDLAGVEQSAKGLPVLQWDKRQAPHMGLVKIDLLGNRALTILEDARREVFRLGGDPEEDGGLGLPGSGFHAALSPRDPLVEPILTKGNTIGVSQIESPGMRSLLIRMEAKSLDEVIQAIALIRPGPAGSGMLDRYVRRARGEEPMPTLPPALAGILAESKGVLLYQEDVIQVLAAFCGTDLVQGDLLRRRVEEGDPSAEREFFEAATRREVPVTLAREFWAQVRRFAGFSFNKAHAVTYGRLSWRLLRLKARYPAALFAALLASETGYYAPAVYVEEAKRCGIPILPPCINRSTASFTTSLGATGPSAAAPGGRTQRMGVPLGTKGAIRVGLGQVRGMPETFVRGILEERAEGGPFFSVGGFVERMARRRGGARSTAQELAIQEAWIEALILVGAFDLCEGTRGEKLWRFRLEFQDRLRAAAQADEPALFPEALAPRTPILPSLPPFSRERRRELEAQLLGFFCGTEPLEGLVRGLVPLSDLHPQIGQRIRVLGHVAALRGHRTRRGERMCFVTLEDATGMLEGVLFPEVWQRFGGTLSEAAVVFLEGKLESREGALVLEVERVECVS